MLVCPPQNLARPVTFGGEQLVPLSLITSRPTMVPGDVNGRRKRIGDGDRQPTNVISIHLPYDDRVQTIIQ